MYRSEALDLTRQAEQRLDSARWELTEALDNMQYAVAVLGMSVCDHPNHGIETNNIGVGETYHCHDGCGVFEPPDELVESRAISVQYSRDLMDMEREGLLSEQYARWWIDRVRKF